MEGVDNTSSLSRSSGADSPAGAPVEARGKGPNLRWLFWLPAVLAAVMVVVMLAALVLVAGRSLQRLDPVQSHLLHIERLHAIGLRMDELLSRELQGGGTIDAADLQQLRNGVLAARQAAGDGNAETRQRLQTLEQLLGAADRSPREILLQATHLLRQIQNRERTLHNALVGIVARDSQLELRLALLLLVTLPLIVGLSFYLLRNRIKRPLDDLNSLLRRLASRDYRPVSETRVDESAGLIQPVYRSYNALVTRLAELEAEHRALQSSLEADVRRATTVLLEQAGDLARAEKLAAVGELSAAMAHEIRNPLAGIQLACTKLGRQLPPEQSRKIDLVVSELKRVNNLLSERLYEARHAPEPLVDVDVAALIDSLVALLNYQVPEPIRLATGVAPGLVCALPESGLRQALLNLVMNAARAIGEGEGRITVSARRRDERLEIEVADSGPGFPRSMIDSGVRPFVTGRVDGTGLGLAIVQRFARTFYGELRLENPPEGGARATLSLPCQTAASGEANTTSND